MHTATKPCEVDLNWLRHAEGYLAVVHEEIERNPNDAEMRELLRAMQTAVAARPNSCARRRQGVLDETVHLRV